MGIINLIKELLDSHFVRFTGNELNLFKKIEKRLGRDVACCLVSLKHFEMTSIKEIEVISQLIEQFKPLSVSAFIDNPPNARKVLISGRMEKHHKIEILPQLKVKNPFPKGRQWSIDLTIKLYRLIGRQYVEIGAVGIEYDGDNSHYLESGVKKAYLRDSHIATENIQIIRISPDAWDADSNYFKKTIKKFFENKIKFAEKIQSHTIKSIKGSSKSLSASAFNKCPICIGEGVLASEFCPACSGVGKIPKGKVVNPDEYEEFDCPECKQLSLPKSSCRTCVGTGCISREKALEIAKNRA